jgi:hypothetical protein
MKNLFTIAALAIGLSGCAQYSSVQMTNHEGQPIGKHFHGFRQTGDFTSWQHATAITDDKTGRVEHFATDRGTGFVDPLLHGAGTAAAGYFIGSGLANQAADQISNAQSQSQGQSQVSVNQNNNSATHVIKKFPPIGR